MAISKGDTIQIDESVLSAAEKQPINIHWQQSLRGHDQNYIEAAYKIVASASSGNAGQGAEGHIFIQANMVNGFKAKAAGNQPKYTVIIDADFQYGQKNSSGEGRFLVYHDKNNKPFQHRFVQGVIPKYGEAAGKIANQFGYANVNAIVKGLEGVVGDPLRSY